MIKETICIYYSRHGHAKKVIDFLDLPSCKIESRCHIHLDKFVVIVCPTYGDEELPLPMEDYLLTITDRNQMFAVCELGNSLNNHVFGAGKIIRKLLIDKLNWQEILRPLFVDSFPVINWESLKIWKKELQNLKI